MTRVSPQGEASGLAIRWITASGAPRPPAPGGSLHRRLRHAADRAWSPAEAVLAARNLSSMLVVAVTLVVAALCALDAGLDGVIINLPALAVAWGATYGLIRLGRWWRGVYPPEHIPSRSAPAARRASQEIQAGQWHGVGGGDR